MNACLLRGACGPPCAPSWCCPPDKPGAVECVVTKRKSHEVNDLKETHYWIQPELGENTKNKEKSAQILSGEMKDNEQNKTNSGLENSEKASMLPGNTVIESLEKQIISSPLGAHNVSRQSKQGPKPERVTNIWFYGYMM